MQGDSALGRALGLVRELRQRCPWDRAQSPQTLRPYLVEEALELDHAIQTDDPEAMRDELAMCSSTSRFRSSSPKSGRSSMPKWSRAPWKRRCGDGTLICSAKVAAALAITPVGSSPNGVNRGPAASAARSRVSRPPFRHC